MLAVLAALLAAAPAAAQSSTIVISEFRTRGPNGDNDEFKEGEPLAPTTANADQPYERQAATRASRACASTRSRAPRTSRPTINTEFADQVSDHDPPIVRFRLRR
jgi:hypothetical protein